MSLHREVFSDDVCFEILSFVEESWLIIQDYALISKQWLNVIRNRIKLYLAFWQEMNDERANLMLQSQFINNINRIIIYNYEFTIDGEMFYKAMQQMKNLTSLSICSHHFGPEGARLVSGVKQLENLVINLNSLGPEGAKIISEMENLKSLIISNNEIDDEGAIYLSEMKKLENLDVSENEIGRDGLKAISKMKQLRRFVNRGGIDLEELSNMDQLTHLDVSESVPAFFASDSILFNNLTKLVMKCCCIGDEEVEKISKFPNLTSLHVSGNQITSKGIKHLKEMKHLATLYIGQNYLNDEGVKIITEMKQLKELNTEESDLSENAREMLLGMKKQLKSLNIDGCEEIQGAKEEPFLDSGWF